MCARRFFLHISSEDVWEHHVCVCGLVEVSSLPGSDTVSLGVATDFSSNKDDWSFRD